jgi:hypothetical protein
MSQLLVVALWRCTSAHMTEHDIEKRRHAEAMADLWRERLHRRADRGLKPVLVVRSVVVEHVAANLSLEASL